jgi:hypothetical protein
MGLYMITFYIFDITGVEIRQMLKIKYSTPVHFFFDIFDGTSVETFQTFRHFFDIRHIFDMY